MCIGFFVCISARFDNHLIKLVVGQSILESIQSTFIDEMCDVTYAMCEVCDVCLCLCVFFPSFFAEITIANDISGDQLYFVKMEIYEMLHSSCWLHRCMFECFQIDSL